VEEWLDSPPGQRKCTIGSTVSGKKKQVPVLHHAAYSPDLAPCHFFLFSKSKHSLKGTHFQSIEDSQRKTTDLLKGFTQNDFQKCFHACFDMLLTITVLHYCLY
jgi:hypothetical protein